MIKYRYLFVWGLSLFATTVAAELRPLADEELSEVHGQGIQISIDVHINSDESGTPLVTESNALRGANGTALRDADGELIANRIVYSNVDNPNETGTLVFDNITGGVSFDDLELDVINYTDTSGSADAISIGLPSTITFDQLRLGDVKVITDAQPGGGAPLFSTEINGNFDLTGRVLIFGRN